MNKTLAQSGMYYLNINTLANSGGELRGHVTPSCNGACFSPILPSAKQFQPKFGTNSSASCSFISCFFPYESVQGVFQSITMLFFTNHALNESANLDIEFPRDFSLNDQFMYKIPIHEFPASFFRGKTLFVRSVFNGLFGESSLSSSHSFVIPVIPNVQIMNIEVQFEYMALKTKCNVPATVFLGRLRRPSFSKFTFGNWV